MKIKHIILCISLLIFAGCVTIVKWKYGITNPREQTPEQLISFLKKHKYPDSSVFVFNDSLSFCRSLRNKAFRKNLLSHMIFDHKGMLLQRDTAKCQWSGYEVIKGLKTDSAYLCQDGIQLSDIVDHLHHIGRGSGNDSLKPQPGFTIIVTWGMFLGNYNSRLFVLSEAVRENKAAGIRLIWLNIDMQKSWNLSKDQKMAFQ